MRRFLIYLIFLPMMLLASGCMQVAQPEGPDGATDFTLSDLGGREVSLAQFKGEANILLVFGTTWCPSCVSEIPELKEIHKKYGGAGLKIISVYIQESREKISSFAKRHSITYIVALDLDGRVASSYGVRGVPYMVIVNRDGGVYYRGFRPRQGLMGLVDKLMGN